MMKNNNRLNKIVVLSLITLLMISSLTVVGFENINKKMDTKTTIYSQNMVSLPYDGQLLVYIVEPTSRWYNYDNDRYHFGFLDFAIDETLSIDYLDTYTKEVTWNAQDAGYSNVKEVNIMAIAVVFNPESHEKFAYPPSQNPFDAHYVDATAGAIPGNSGENFVNETITHTVFCEEGTATWCQYCPVAAEGLYSVYESGEYPFYFVAMVADENDKANDRLTNYNMYGYPTCFFDGGYSVVVGAASENTYRNKVRIQSGKDVHDLNLSLSVEWVGNGIIDIGVTITNNEEMPNRAPDIPLIDGPTSGKANEEQEYSILTNDPEGNNVYYYIEWGDGELEEWIGPYESGDLLLVSHTWNEKDSYIIQVKAKDIDGDESDWATLEISMPKNKPYNLFILWFEKLLNNFPLLERLLDI